MGEMQHRFASLLGEARSPEDVARSAGFDTIQVIYFISKAFGPMRGTGFLKTTSAKELRHKLQIDSATFRSHAKLGQLYFWDLKLPIETVEELGLSKARILQLPLNRLIADNRVTAARKLALHCMGVKLARIEQRPFLNLLVSQAIADTLPERGTVSSSQLDSLLASPTDQGESDRQDVLGRILGQIERGPKHRFPDPPRDFIVDPRVWRQLTMATQIDNHVLITGPAGCGKTELIERLAAATRRELSRFSFGAMSDPRTSIIGSMHYRVDKGTQFSMSRFAKSLQKPNSLILLDELNRCDRDAFNLLIPLLDGQRYLSLDEAEGSPVIRVAENVSFIATANIGTEYSGARNLDAAIRDRFGTQIAMEYPKASQEIELIERRYHNVGRKNAQKLVQIASRQRELCRDGEFEYSISTRMLMSAAKMLEYGLPLEDAIEFGMTNHFSGEGGTESDRVRFRQLAQRYNTIF